VPGDEIHPDPYSRSHSSFHSSQSYRTPSTSSRVQYITDQDISSRPRRDKNWRHADLDRDRYPYNDPFRADMSEYDGSGPRSSSGWVSVDVPSYSPAYTGNHTQAFRRRKQPPRMTINVLVANAPHGSTL